MGLDSVIRSRIETVKTKFSAPPPKIFGGTEVIFGLEENNGEDSFCPSILYHQRKERPWFFL